MGVLYNTTCHANEKLYGLLFGTPHAHLTELGSDALLTEVGEAAPPH
jgi:hypothetical protein